MYIGQFTRRPLQYFNCSPGFSVAIRVAVRGVQGKGAVVVVHAVRARDVGLGQTVISLDLESKHDFENFLWVYHTRSKKRIPKETTAEPRFAPFAGSLLELQREAQVSSQHSYFLAAPAHEGSFSGKDSLYRPMKAAFLVKTDAES